MQIGIKMPRGRPRQYDEDAALEAAMRLFWSQGYTATSLDELAQATGMNRPSLYNAFGNKKAIYRRAMDRFAQRMMRETVDRLEDNPDIVGALVDYYDAALDVYFDAEEPQGCFFFCTAAPEAPGHGDIRADVMAAIHTLDEAFEQRLVRAQADGQLPDDADPRVLAALAQAVQHSLSIRTRAGSDKNTLRAMARSSVAALMPVRT